MNIVLIQPPVQDFYQTRIRTQPLGLAFLAAALREHGHRVTILDSQSENRKKKIPLPEKFSFIREFYSSKDFSPFRLYTGYHHFGLSFDDIAARVREINPDLAGISCQFTPYTDIAFKTAEVVKAAWPKVTVVFGGAHASACPEAVLGCPRVDYVVIGEGERTFVRLAEKVSQGESPLDLDGVAGRQGRETVINPVKGYIDDIDSLCFPARDLLDTAAYTIRQKRYTMLLTSRGCPQGCSYCSVAGTMGTGFRPRSPQNVIAEMSQCVRDHGMTAFDFEDDNFTLDPARAEQILDRIIDVFGEGRLDLYAMNGLSVFSLTKPLLQKMKKAGFRHLDLALGSSSGKINRAMNRPDDMKKADAVLRQAADLGFPVNAYIILGIPDHRLEDMTDAIIYLAGQPVLVGPSIFYPSPGTPVYTGLQQNGYALETDFSRLRSTLFPVETNDFSRLDLVTLLRFSRWLNFIKQRITKDMPLETLRETALSRWHPGSDRLGRAQDTDSFHLVLNDRLSADAAGEMLSALLFEHNLFYGIRRKKQENKALYTYRIFPYKTSQKVIKRMLASGENFLVRRAINKP